MKKLLFVVLAASAASSFAMSKVNLAEETVMCNKIQLTNKSTEDFLTKNCTNAEVKYFTHVVGVQNNNVRVNNGAVPSPTVKNNYSRVKFISDEGHKMDCYYKAGTFEYCKIVKAKKGKSAASDAADE